MAADDDRSMRAHQILFKWRSKLLHAIDQVRKEIIQVKSPQNRNGLIQSSWRTVTNVRYLDAVVNRVRQRVIETGGSYDIFPDVYAFCWDCLEADLVQLRRYMARDFLAGALTSLKNAYGESPSDVKQILWGPVAAIGTEVKNRVYEVCGWFIRPVFRRNEYSLKTLINTYFSTVKELDENYNFAEHLIMEQDISIDRLTF
jgi:hypothetical protein